MTTLSTRFFQDDMWHEFLTILDRCLQRGRRRGDPTKDQLIRLRLLAPGDFTVPQISSKWDIIQEIIHNINDVGGEIEKMWQTISISQTRVHRGPDRCLNDLVEVSSDSSDTEDSDSDLESYYPKKKYSIEIKEKKRTKCMWGRKKLKNVKGKGILARAHHRTLTTDSEIYG